MRRASFRKPSLVAPFPEQVAEAVNRERSAGGCHQKGQVSAFRRGDDLGEARMSWDRQLGAGFLLRYRQDAFADVLRPHAHDVAAALPGVEQKRHRQSGPRSDGVVRLELFYLALGPRMDAAGFCFGWLESGGRIAADLS